MADQKKKDEPKTVLKLSDNKRQAETKRPTGNLGGIK